ncbi:Metallo-dependent hydrolase [Rhizopogon vinicolor AM-OR11-026]|uniref:Metallo-dependent hydrolase n=1 Tax=Rhizopogon vinicolor AM-OR11-026 TaxID=1314800 RepID=A0A1B7N1M9_9AGAM|nr:Metallo-dependent hydrolase [Rhizopogon vinicolor AM-OR11-026]
MASYSLSENAYLKIFFHAAKHPHLPVNGVLLGRRTSDAVVIEDVIPLLHHWTSLSPMMEIGLDLAKGHAEAQEMTLVGYYQASEKLDDTALAPVGERVAQKIRDQFSDAVAFVIDGDKLGAGVPALIPYLPQPSTSFWRPYVAQTPAFTAGSNFSLTNPDSPSRAITLVRDHNLHEKFGDFDDHLEDVTIDWLRNKASFKGTLVHCPSLGQLEILEDHLLLVDQQGFITYVGPADSEASQDFLGESGVPLTTLPSGSFLLPTFCDLHLHAPQFLFQGTGLHLPLMQWLNEYAFKAEESLDSQPELAELVYRRLAERLRDAGTGAVLLFGTINTTTNLILAKAMQTVGIRAFVGKLSMDISSRPTYIEPSATSSLRSAEEFIDGCRNLVSSYEPHRRLVEPVITPRFVPTCSDDLLQGLGKLAHDKGVRIQSHMAEAREEVQWVLDERNKHDIDIFDECNLQTTKTVQAHCTFLDTDMLTRMAGSCSAVAHCPLSNSYFSEKPFPLREALDLGVRVGLGTDIAGGYSIDIMNSMRQAVAVSRIREGTRKISDNSSNNGVSLAVDWKDVLYLATRGGAISLGLSSGVFQAGAPFDAQCIEVLKDGDKGVGALDFFEAQSGITLDSLEKWWCIGDERNRCGVWIQGQKLGAK